MIGGPVSCASCVLLFFFIITLPIHILIILAFISCCASGPPCHLVFSEVGGYGRYEVASSSSKVLARTQGGSRFKEAPLSEGKGASLKKRSCCSYGS